MAEIDSPQKINCPHCSWEVYLLPKDYPKCPNCGEDATESEEDRRQRLREKVEEEEVASNWGKLKGCGLIIAFVAFLLFYQSTCAGYDPTPFD